MLESGRKRCVFWCFSDQFGEMGGEVHLDIYDDRIAVTSPGGMYSGQNVQDFAIEEISSVRRNPVLADGSVHRGV